MATVIDDGGGSFAWLAGIDSSQAAAKVANGSRTDSTAAIISALVA
jgi:hypothetical protein